MSGTRSSRTIDRLIANNPSPVPVATTQEKIDAHLAALLSGRTDDLERSCRAAFLAPGLRGSWGRGVPRTWACGFDPKGDGCECAGGGRTEVETEGCFYREPVGEKAPLLAVGDKVLYIGSDLPRMNMLRGRTGTVKSVAMNSGGPPYCIIWPVTTRNPLVTAHYGGELFRAS